MVLAYITTKDKDEAVAIGKALLTKKLAACINIIEKMHSFYWWEGKIEEAQESILIAKTDERLMDKLIDEVKKLHSYDTPCVLSVPIEKGNPDYLKWLSESL